MLQFKLLMPRAMPPIDELGKSIWGADIIGSHVKTSFRDETAGVCLFFILGGRAFLPCWLACLLSLLQVGKGITYDTGGLNIKPTGKPRARASQLYGRNRPHDGRGARPRPWL